MTAPLNHVGAPPDGVAWGALAAAAALLAAGAALRMRPAWRAAVERRATWILIAWCVAAFVASWGWVVHYLGGGPRIIDATSYWLEARTLAGGQFTMPLDEPSGSFRGRFLVTTPDGASMGVIFPPGYPAVLALGFLAGAPLLVGPTIGAALVWATFTLAKRVTESEEVALGAAALSATCAALRYHSADTMSHGLASLLFSTALIGAWSARRWAPLCAGLACGWLLATRPVTGVVAVLVVGALTATGTATPARRLGLGALGLAPGVLLLLVYQRSVTGSALVSPQAAYYALADGPPGCFGWGFGTSIGCRHEHGEFVRTYLPDGYGPWEALGTTLRRLRHHVLDVANAEPLAALLPVAAWMGWARARIRTITLGVAALLLAYVPFYFDGNYPGGGARMFAEALPLEHVLVAFALSRWHAAWLGAPAALTGFALHASASHVALAAREGGRPMFEKRVLDEAGVHAGLVFVGTDHGFNLGYDPTRTSPVVVARERGDARDRLLWERLGRPSAWRYLYDAGTPSAAPHLAPYEPRETLDQEAEAEWPLRALAGGAGYPVHFSSRCDSNGKGLLLESAPGGRARAEVDVTIRAAGPHLVVTRWVSLQGEPLDVAHVTDGNRWGGRRPAGPGECLDWASPALPLDAGRVQLGLEVSGRAVLDKVIAWPVPGAP